MTATRLEPLFAPIMSYEQVAFVALALLLLGEVILSATFTKWYFRFGLPIFIRRFPAPQRVLPDFEERLDRELDSVWSPPFTFRRFSPTEVAFRERAFAWRLFSYTPVMHGLVRLVPDEGTVYVIGWANGSALIFCGLLLLISRIDRIILLFGVGVLALIYLIQRRRFGRVADLLWAEEPIAPGHEETPSPRSAS